MTGGKAALDVHGPYPATPDVLVTADKLSSVLLSGGITFGRMVEHGGTVLLNGAFGGDGANVLLDANLAESGRIGMGSAQSSTGVLEVTGSVGADVTIAVYGEPARGIISAVTLDAGLADHGTVPLESSTLILKNLGALDSMSYKDSMLSLYRGNMLVGAVKVSGVADQALWGPGINGVLSFAYSAGTLTVHDGGTAANAMGFGTVTGLALHA